MPGCARSTTKRRPPSTLSKTNLFFIALAVVRMAMRLGSSCATTISTSSRRSRNWRARPGSPFRARPRKSESARSNKKPCSRRWRLLQPFTRLVWRRPRALVREIISVNVVSIPRRSGTFAWVGRRMSDRRCAAAFQVMFPIGNRTGRVIAFGGRMIGDGQPKYLNSPESTLFEKGRVLYGWAAARAGLARESPSAGPGVIVTEGYMDVIALHRAGFPTAVAPLGTALTDFQLHDLWRLGSEPVLCFDGDAAGQRAAARALYRALPFLVTGRSLRFASLPAGEDPDSLIRGAGRSAFEAILGAARPLSDMLWEIELAAKPRNTPERLADVWRRLISRVELIPDRKVQAEYRNLFYKRFDPRSTATKSRERVRQGSSAMHDGPPPRPRPPQRMQREILFRILF